MPGTSEPTWLSKYRMSFWYCQLCCVTCVCQACLNFEPFNFVICNTLVIGSCQVDSRYVVGQQRCHNSSMVLSTHSSLTRKSNHNLLRFCPIIGTLALMVYVVRYILIISYRIIAHICPHERSYISKCVKNYIL